MPKNPIVKNIKTKFGWSLREYCQRRGLVETSARHVVYNKVGKELREDAEATKIIKALSDDAVYVRMY